MLLLGGRTRDFLKILDLILDFKRHPRLQCELELNSFCAPVCMSYECVFCFCFLKFFCHFGVGGVKEIKSKLTGLI